MKRANHKFWALLTLVLLAVIVLYAGGDKMEKMKAELNLSDAQVSQLEQRMGELQPLADRAKAIKAEIKELESSANPDANAISAKRTALEAVKKEWHQKAEAVYRSVLTPEQWTKYEAMKAQHKAEGKKY
jgi:Spy/CpxP family protein refolding chaperone